MSSPSAPPAASLISRSLAARPLATGLAGHIAPQPGVAVDAGPAALGVMAGEHLGTPGSSRADHPGVVLGMATKKVTISIDENQLERIRALVEAGTTSSVSGFVQHAVGVAIDDVAGGVPCSLMLSGIPAGSSPRGEAVGRRGAWCQRSRQELGCLVAGITMDPGGLIVVDRNDRRVVVLLVRAGPASALVQAVRQPERQARLARLLRQPTTDVVPLGRVDATNVGRLLAASGTSDVVDAHVVICARRALQQIITSDPSELRALDPALRVVAI